MSERSDYISLKEAAKLSGYSADYVGQLIRAGKLSGKQVFSNVAWVTTEAAILEYIKKEKKGKSDFPSRSLKERFFTTGMLVTVYPVIAWTAIGILGLFVLLLVYIFSVSIDHKINQGYLDKIEHAQ